MVGNVITDPVLRRTGDDKPVVNFRMASTERRLDRETGEWVDGESFFVGVSAWKRLAESVADSLSKGDPVVVFGRVYTRGYEVDGQRRQATELVANVVGPDLTRCTARVSRAAKSAESAYAAWPQADAAHPVAV
jgi:single-strand DNA-binding protein